MAEPFGAFGCNGSCSIKLGLGLAFAHAVATAD